MARYVISDMVSFVSRFSPDDGVLYISEGSGYEVYVAMDTGTFIMGGS